MTPEAEGERRGPLVQHLASHDVVAEMAKFGTPAGSRLEGPVESLGDSRFRLVLDPSLDDTNRRQFRGCLTDWTIDHVKVEALSMTDMAPAPGDRAANE